MTKQMDDIQTERLEKRMREKIVIGKQVSEKFQKYVESGDFSRNVDFRTNALHTDFRRILQYSISIDSVEITYKYHFCLIFLGLRS